MKKYPVPEKLKAFASIFKEHGYSVYLVGGAVRDHLLGIENHDYDFTTDAMPEEVKGMFRRTIDTGIKHGTVTVLFQHEQFEVTTFRAESDYSDMRHPDAVKFIRNLDEDLKRRDFTINAFAADLSTGEIIDRHHGFEDLENHVIRAIGNPIERFTEDALRMLRAARFSSKLSFDIEKETLDAMKSLAGNISHVSAERIKDELFRLILSKDPLRGLETLRKTGLMELILPELSATIGVEQGGDHDDTVYEHSLKALERALKNNHSDKVRLAALFHDIGKVKTRVESDGDRPYTFYGHDEVGAELWTEIAKRLKCSNEERDSVALLIRNHMFAYSSEWTDAAIRRFMKKVGVENIPELIDLRTDDAESISGFCYRENLRELEARVRDEVEKASALTIKDLEINGGDLIRIGVKPGPMMGRILEALLDEVIELPSLNRKEYLLEKAKKLSELLK